MKVLNFGSLNVDYVYQVDSILIPGETRASKGRTVFFG
ncbi:MAG: ribokinase, partial [Blautia sp.]|nr:ribokinase [Blautia sp.]